MQKKAICFLKEMALSMKIQVLPQTQNHAIIILLAEVAEWQTHLTQNQAGIPHAGSSPAFGTKQNSPVSFMIQGCFVFAERHFYFSTPESISSSVSNSFCRLLFSSGFSRRYFSIRRASSRFSRLSGLFPGGSRLSVRPTIKSIEVSKKSAI